MILKVDLLVWVTIISSFILGGEKKSITLVIVFILLQDYRNHWIKHGLFTWYICQYFFQKTPKLLS